ncbi:transposase [Candidatus Saccharibacteria bacterium]|nr:MAG: transposase [Candidatus Saccharibacteria bacterium]
MPGKNIIKQYAPESYYHLYTRGVNKNITFDGEADFTVFIGLLKRYLSPKPSKSNTRHVYPSFVGRLELLAYALMPNHIHLFVYQHDQYAIRDFMRALLTSYCMQYNKVHKRVGPLFQSRYRASLIGDDAYLQHISRYIHLNPHDWRESDKTSLDFYLGKRHADWISTKRIMEYFSSSENYLDFLEDYEDVKKMYDEIKWDLATIENPDPESPYERHLRQGRTLTQ